MKSLSSIPPAKSSEFESLLKMNINPKINDGGSAFPNYLMMNEGRVDISNQYGVGGMSLRAWLAGAVSLSAYDERLIRLFSEDPTPGHGVEETIAYTAKLRIRNADALIAYEASTRQASQ